MPRFPGLFRLVFWLALVALPLGAPAQTPAPIAAGALTRPLATRLPKPDDVLSDSLATNNYLAPYLLFNELGPRYPDQSLLLLMSAYVNSYLGNYTQAYAAYDKLNDPKEMEADLQQAPIDGYQAVSARQAIAAIAEKAQVIMTNEEHDTPMHRAFTTELLPILYAKGFRYFAAEVLSDYDADLMQRGYPTQIVVHRPASGVVLHGTGFYSADPVFGDLIRTALKLGFKVVPYESRNRAPCTPTVAEPELCQNQREQGQAQNLYDRILRQDPKAKILVHAGRGHNSEATGATGWVPMAVYFKRLTGIDPFTINQMPLSERSAPKYETPLYRYVTQKMPLTQPTVFTSSAAGYYGGGRNDLLVFHPRAVYENGRPTWLRMGGWRKPYNLNVGTLRKGSEREVSVRNPVLVQAFGRGESADAVPVDQVLVTNWQVPPTLVLPKGSYRIRAIIRTGEVLAQYEFVAK